MLKSFTIAQKSGAFTCAISVVWTYFLGILHAYEQIGAATDWVDGLVRMALPVALSVPGVVLFVFSWKLMRGEPTRDRIKNAFGMLFGMGAFFLAFLAVWLGRLWFGRSDLSVDLIVALLLSVLVILPSNAGVARYVMRASGIVPVRGEFVGRGSYTILAFLMWAILSPMGVALAEDYRTDTVMDLGFVFLPFIIPYILYRLAVKYLVRDTFAEQVALDYPSNSEETEV